jgi:hypothetical protein
VITPQETKYQNTTSTMKFIHENSTVGGGGAFGRAIKLPIGQKPSGMPTSILASKI